VLERDAMPRPAGATPLALNEQQGKWTLRVADVTSGAARALAFQVHGEG